MNTISKRIRQLREDKNYSRKKLAETADVSQPTIYNIENGKTDNITLQVGKRIAHALDIPFSVLFEIDSLNPDAKEEFNSLLKDIEKKLLEEKEEVLKSKASLEEKNELLILTNELLQKRINAYKRFIFISAEIFMEPYIHTIESEIRKAKSDKEKMQLEEKIKSIHNNFNELLHLCIDIDLLTKEDIEKYRNNNPGDIYLSLFNKESS